jgi:hypothetical protein
LDKYSHSAVIERNARIDNENVIVEEVEEDEAGEIVEGDFIGRSAVVSESITWVEGAFVGDAIAVGFSTAGARVGLGLPCSSFVRFVISLSNSKKSTTG